MSEIQLSDVTRTAPRGAVLLDQINLNVAEGQCLAIVGPTRAGKTLLLRILAGLDEVSEGEIRIGDAVVNAHDPRARDLAMVFQDFEIYPNLDVFDNIAFSSKLRKGYKKDELADRITDVADLLGLGDKIDARPADLNDSERQRVALARVLVRDANAYLFDDPFSALDGRVRSQVRSMTSQWQRELSRTSIFVTSDISEALSIGDTVAVLHQGFIHQCASPRELYEKPVDMFVASFIGSPPMNLIPAKVLDKALQLPFAEIALRKETREHIGDRDLVIVGIRPEDCGSLDGPAAGSAPTFASTIDEVEWRGSGQYVYLSFEMEEQTERRLQEIEDDIDFDLFQSHLMAAAGSGRHFEEGSSIEIALDVAKMHLFDATTGARIEFHDAP